MGGHELTAVGRDTEAAASAARLAPYLPLLVRAWSLEPGAPRHRTLAGSLVSVDISGFTSLTERLATKGRAGEEELVRSISACFEGLIDVATRHGGDVLKFRGDALLLFFTGERHARRAAGAASDMQDWIDTSGRIESSVGPVELRMAAGVHTGDCHFFLVERPYRELVVGGPAASGVCRLEDAAGAGEITLSPAAAEAVDPAWLDGERDGFALMRRLEPGSSPTPPPEDVAGRDLDLYVPPTLAAHLSVASGEAELRHVTVAFVKLSGSDAVIEAEGPAALLARIDALAEVVADASETYGVTWLHSDIDVGAVRLYLTSGAPSSRGDDAEGMLRAARAIVDAGLVAPVQVGVNRGNVFTGDIGAPSRRTYAVMGDTVNLAARLAARASPGEILATSNVLDRARRHYASEREPLLVKGKDRAVMAHHVGAPLGPREGPQIDMVPLIGREPELERLGAALEAARLRQQQVVELVGEPGIGKSRLLRELRGQALGFTQLAMAAEPYSSAVPFSAWRDVLRQLAGITPERSREEAGTQLGPWIGGVMPDLAPWLPLLAIAFDAEVPSTPEVDALEPADAHERLHRSVETFLERVLMMPTLLVVEDAHWLDDASRFLLRRLVAGTAPRPWLVCVTTRPSAERLVAEDGPGVWLELEPLGGDAAEALALAVAQEHALSTDEVAVLAGRSGGNPLFVRELVFAARHGGADALPESVETLLTSRIDVLAPADRMLLRYASVLGPTFDPALLAELLGDEVPDAGEPARWDVLGEFVSPAGGSSLAFRHDLVRATAYAGLSFRRRREIHGRVGAALERRAGAQASEEAALLSLHFFEAGEHDRAWAYAAAAGRQAQQRFANVIAAELYERALAAARSLPDIGAPELAEVSEALGDVRERFGAYEPAFDAYERARELRAGGTVDEARLLRKEGSLHEHGGRHDDALEHYARGLALLDSAPEGTETGATRAEIELGAAGVHYRQGRFEEAVAVAQAAVANAEAAGDRGVLAHACFLLCAASGDLGQPQAVDFGERALAIYEELRDDKGQGEALNNLGIVHYYAGRWDVAGDCYRRSREAKLRAGNVIGAAISAANEAEILSDQGRLDEAEVLFREMQRLCRAAGHAVGAAVATGNLARAAARAGRFEQARELYAEALDVFEAVGAARWILETRARLAECDVFEGRHREALELVEQCRAEQPAGVPEALLERVYGYALCQARRPDEARPHFDRSIAVARELKARYEEVLTQRAIVDTGRAADPALAAEVDETLARLGVVSLPRVPLP
ncbi:MAG TPA: tetratricopeptide repeat protein [Gaiellaceae bacterium]